MVPGLLYGLFYYYVHLMCRQNGVGRGECFLVRRVWSTRNAPLIDIIVLLKAKGKSAGSLMQLAYVGSRIAHRKSP